MRGARDGADAARAPAASSALGGRARRASGSPCRRARELDDEAGAAARRAPPPTRGRRAASRARAPPRARCRSRRRRDCTSRSGGRTAARRASRSLGGMPGPSSSTDERARSPARAQRDAHRLPGGPYLTALSSRLSSDLTQRAAVDDAHDVVVERRLHGDVPRERASGANASSASRTSSPGRPARARAAAPAARARENCRTFSTRCVSRRASWSMISQRARAAPLAPDAAEQQRLGEHAHLRERRAQLVRHAGDEVRAQPRELVLAAQLQERRWRRARR